MPRLGEAILKRLVRLDRRRRHNGATDPEDWQSYIRWQFDSSAGMFGKYPGLDWRGKSVLEVGCGTGGRAAYLAATGASRVVGIDINAAEMEIARRELPGLYPAAAGKRVNVDEALSQEPDSDVTKGYYQWSSMAFYELATSDFPETQRYGDTVLRLADWMIDDHHVLIRTRNTGYAFEGLIHAYARAKQRGDSARQAKYGCVIDLGLEHLMSWQVGGPNPNRYTAAPTKDPRAIGGIQNAAFEPALRIDVTQHQMHATLLARQYVY